MNDELRAYPIEIEGDWYKSLPIEQGYRIGNLVFLSGQAALDENEQVVGPDDMHTQAARVFDQIDLLLTRAGSRLDNVLKMTVYLTDLGDRAVLRKHWEQRFHAPWPASTLVEVSALILPDLRLEIDLVALVGGSKQG